MKFPQEQTGIVEGLPFESRLGFVAFNVERCLSEARSHAVARRQLEALPLLSEGLSMLWDRAERRSTPDPSRVEAVIEHLQGYETPMEDMENVRYNHDVILVEAARTLMKGMNLLKDASRTARYVAGALSGPFQAVALVYADHRAARSSEMAVADAALLRLRDWGQRPFHRSAFEGIPDWPRGAVSKRYASGGIGGTAEDDEHDLGA